MTRLLPWRTVVAGLLCLAFAGCGSDREGAGDDSTTSEIVSETTPEATAPERTVVTASEAEQQSALTFGVDEVIRFDVGGTSATISNAVVRGERNRYTLEAAAGQTMNVDVESLEDNAVFDVLGPDGAVLATEVTTASIVLPADGVYSLILGGTRGNASYDLTVEIPAG